MSPFARRNRSRGRNLVHRWFGGDADDDEPAARKVPTKRASYAGHELSFSDGVVDFDSKLEYWPSDDDDDVDNSFSQAEAKMAEDGHLSCSEHTGRTKMTARTGELTCTTDASSQQQALPIPTLRRRVSAPPILGLTVEAPSPPSSPPPPSIDSISLDGDSLHASTCTDESVDDDRANSEHNQSIDAAYSLVSPDRSSATPRPASRLTLPASPASPRSATEHRSVRFNPRTRVYLHLHLNDCTDAELAASYLNGDDTSRIQRDIVDSIVRMRADRHQEQGHDDNSEVVNGEEEEIEDEDEDENQHCPRGLEALATPTSASALRAARIRHIDAVLDEQDRQFLRGINDEDRLAQAAISAARSTNTVAEPHPTWGR